ncbi:MAG: type II secretion system minor pseudopilin GspJ [Pseudomonadota bacterium]
MRNAGFTLIEMLVALFVFAVISTASVSMLTFTLRSQQALEAASERTRELELFRTVLKADLAQARSRPVRGPFGDKGVSFFGAADLTDEVILAFTRAGWENPGGAAARSSLQYVEYVLEDDVLIRRARPRLDATPETPVTERQVLNGVTNLNINYIASGVRRDAWIGQAGAAGALPDIIEMTIIHDAFGEVRQLFLVAGDL